MWALQSVEMFKVRHLSIYTYLYLRREGTKASHQKRYHYGHARSLVSSPPLFLSSPAMPILHMNSHSIWGALLRLVNRPLRHKKGHPQATQSLRAAFCSLPVLNGSHRFLQSLFSYHVLLRYACLIHMSSCLTWGAFLSLATRPLHR